MTTSISSSSFSTTIASSSLDVSKDTEEVNKFLREKFLEATFPHENPLRRPFMHGTAERSFYLQWYNKRNSSSSSSSHQVISSSLAPSSESKSASRYPLHRLAHSSSQFSSSSSSSSFFSFSSSSSSAAAAAAEAEITGIDLSDLTQKDVDRITEVWLRVNSSSSITQQFAGLDILSMVPKVKLEEKINTLQNELNKELRNSSCISLRVLEYYLGFGYLAQKAQDIKDLEYVKDRILVEIKS